jgi:DNA-binding beta-propeller fold protein YncE
MAVGSFWQASHEAGSSLVAVVQAQSSQNASSSAAAEDERPIRLARDPIRRIKNEGAIFSAVAVDPVRGEIVMQDEGNERIMVYDRTANTPPGAAFTEPKRIIGGRNTLVQDNCGIYVDPVTGEIYSITGDTSHNMAIFAPDSKGNVKPARVLKIPHRGFGIAADEESQELFLTAQWPAAVFAFRKQAEGREAPLRIIEGPTTKLAGTVGLALDTKSGELLVGNWGSTSDPYPGMSYSGIPIYGEGKYRTWETADQLQQFFRRRMAPGTGRINPPSILTFPIKGHGDIAPERVIQGPNAQLNWPGHMYMDVERRELYVANTLDDSVLVFRSTDTGNVAPIRVIKGPRTNISRPLGVYFDAKHQEVVVSTWGNQRALIFSRTANGDVAPIRQIRSAPDGVGSPQLSHLGGMSFDTKREEILAYQ